VETTFRVPREGWIDRGRGWYGYKHRIDLGEFGLLAYGGEAQRDTLHVELNAHACARIEDWHAVQVFMGVYSAAITRADVAHDDFEAASVDVERAVAWYRAGEFNANGRPPRAELWDDMGSGRGKALYVGRRASGKLVRMYEKGKQLGDPTSPWVRVEVEFRNKGRIVPLDIVTSPDRYLAGAYPALAYLCADQSRIRTTQRAAAIAYAAMVRNLRIQGGKSLNVMCRVHQGDCSAVLAQLVREGVPKRLAGYGEALEGIGAQHGVDA
jgi:phage replication initiation protein